MQQTVSLIAGMTKVFKSANNNQQYKDFCKCQKENLKDQSQNQEPIKEFIKKNTIKGNQKETVMIQGQLQRK